MPHVTATEPWRRWLADLINTTYDMAGAQMLTQVQAATTLATLKSGLRAMSVHQQHKTYVEYLIGALQTASDMDLFGANLAAENAAIAALTTINTADAATDLLYLLARQYDTTNITKRTRTGSFQRVGHGA